MGGSEKIAICKLSGSLGQIPSLVAHLTTVELFFFDCYRQVATVLISSLQLDIEAPLG